MMLYPLLLQYLADSLAVPPYTALQMGVSKALNLILMRVPVDTPLFIL
jgi:hypothetical protein